MTSNVTSKYLNCMSTGLQDVYKYYSTFFDCNFFFVVFGDFEVKFLKYSKTKRKPTKPHQYISNLIDFIKQSI